MAAVLEYIVAEILELSGNVARDNKRVTINRNAIEELIESKTSPMPAGLFNRMTREEILDLTAYLISGGDAGHELFKK